MVLKNTHTGGSAAFSLVELLVVIGIMGILSATFFGIFSSARRAGRDSRRIADLLRVEQALRLYYAKCGMYPGSFDLGSEECVGGEVPDLGANPATWDDLADALKKADIGIQSIPNDPLPSATYEYFVQLREQGKTPRAQCYILKAVLEEDNKILQKDLDNVDIETKLLPAGSAMAEKYLFPVTPDCDDTSLGGKFNYCMGNLECFHGN
jgi:prepilin-type N-terminal cleavage/methylation domain-containing protein